MKRLLLIMLGLLPVPSYSIPIGPDAFCNELPEAYICKNKSADCALCHSGPPSLNPYGSALGQEIQVDFSMELAAAIEATHALDSDGDGTANKEELTLGYHPGDAASKPIKDSEDTKYSHELALKRVYSTYCGIGLNYEKAMAFKKSKNQEEFLHRELDTCLETPYWKNNAIHRLADDKIRPLSTVGFGGDVVIGDYRFDYRLFSYVLTGNRDARELLTANYHVDAEGNKILGVIPRQEPPQLGERIVIAGGEPLEPGRRYGMITTQWFFANFTMFAELPRNTASQAYRAYLGLDLAKGEGLFPVPGEPRDVDNKNIDQPACAVCHSTLDPLAYSFANYIGIGIVDAFLFNTNGQYQSTKTPWEPYGVFMGQPVANLGEWVQMAIKSKEFKINLAEMFFEHAVGRLPGEEDREEFQQLYEKLPEDNYSANKLIHRLVKTIAFGGE